MTIALTGRAAEMPYLLDLELLSRRNDHLQALLERVNQPRNAQELQIGLDWLRVKSGTGFGGSRITYSYASNLFRVGVKDTATLAFLFGLLTSRVDAARCADPSAPAEKLHPWEQTLVPIYEHFRSLPEDERRHLVNLAIDMEGKLSARGPDIWMCSGGLSFTRKFMEKHKDNPNPPMREINDPTRKGRTILLNDPDLTPDLVPDEQWKTTRQQIIANFAQQLPMGKQQ